jgi:hypothetical protein
MAGKQVQRRRGTSVQHSTFIGAAGEVTVDTNKHTQVVHDGATPGGHPMATEAAVVAAQADADAAQAAADAAQADADAAQATADAAQATAADLVYKADLRTSNTYTGVGLRHRADFSSGVGSLANRYVFQSSTVNGATVLTAMPNGTGASSAFSAYSSTNLENSPFAYLQMGAAGAVVAADKTGSAAYTPLLFQTSGATRLRIEAAGAVNVQSDIGGTQFGTFRLASADGVTYSRTFTLLNNNGLYLANHAGSVYTHILGDNGDITATGAIQGASVVSTGAMSCAGTFYPGAIQNAGVTSSNGDIYTAGMVRATTNTSGGEAQMYRIRDANQCTAGFRETEVGVTVVCSYLLGNGYRTIGPNTDGGVYSGWTLARYAAIFAVTGAINTSDQREKTELRAFSTEEMEVAKSLATDIGMYQWLTAVEAKGEDARLHAGTIAQTVVSRFAEQGLDAHRYGLLCYDEWEAADEVLTPDGAVHSEAREAGNRYGLRYDELNQFILRGMAENQRLLEARIAALEAA